MKKKYLSKINANDNEGLQIISACCSGAKLKVGYIKYLKKNKVFLLSLIRSKIETESKEEVRLAKRSAKSNSLEKNISNIKDRFFSTHRSHAHYLAKGGNLDCLLIKSDFLNKGITLRSFKSLILSSNLSD